jgi:hypothetical protein
MTSPFDIVCPSCGAVITIERVHVKAHTERSATVAIPAHAERESSDIMYSDAPSYPIVALFRARCAASDGEAVLYL